MGHRSRSLRKKNKGPASAIAIMMGLLRVGLPLLVIAGAAFYFINFRASNRGLLRVTASQPNADILIGGVQTGLSTDTTLQLGTGRKIITVRKPQFVSYPEFAVVEVADGELCRAHFEMTPIAAAAESADSVAPLHPARADRFSTGELVQVVPPAGPRRHKRLVDYRTKGTVSQDISDGSAVARGERANGAQVAVESQPPGARIRINGNLSDRTTPATYRGLARGSYVFRVEMDGYLSVPDSSLVVIREDLQRDLIVFVLRENTSLPKPTISVETTPLAAGIRIDGVQAGIGSVRRESGYGVHRIDFADVAGFVTPAPVTVQLSEGEPDAQVTGAYERILGKAYVAVIPDESIAAFQSSQLRVYVDNELLIDNPNSRFDVALLGRIVSGKRLVRVQYGDLQNETYVSLLDGEVAEVEFRIETFFSKRSLKLKVRSPLPRDNWDKKVAGLTVFSGT